MFQDTFKTNNNIDFVKNYVYNEDKDELESTSIDGVFTTNYGYGDDSSITVFENVFNIKEDGTLLDGYIFNYGYKNENISSETLAVKSTDENGVTATVNESVSYEYDDNDQLVKATSSTTEWTYEYDSRGNIITKSIRDVATDNTVTYNYTYDSVWQDRLVSYNGEPVSYEKYDENGVLIANDPSNPLIYRGNELTWTMGRQLASFGDITYTYNEDGIRTSKTSNGVTTKFLLDRYNVIEQTDGTTTLHFFYDSNGEVIGFRYNENDYFYVKNAMSDIIAITDSNKNIVAEYRYDPWGDILSISCDTVIGELNPFRYRSYYYDSDIQMYYLQSRYYDAEVGRFINCDDVSYIGVDDTVASYNAFAYCENNPVKNSDPEGYCYYSADLKWRHDSWEYKGNYKLKKAPKISSYLFPSYYKIKNNNYRIMILRYKKKARLKDYPATTKYVFFITHKYVKYLLCLLQLKKVFNDVQELIKQLNKNGLKDKIKERIKKDILKALLKAMPKAAAKTFTSFVTVYSVDLSFLLDRLILKNEIDRIRMFKREGNGVVIANCKYTKESTITLSGEEWMYIEKWDCLRIYNITNSNFYIYLL